MSELETNQTVFGTKTSQGRPTLGFSLLGAGVILGLAALSLFLIGYFGFNEPNLGSANPYLDWARIALTLAPLALGAILLGVSTALPTTFGLRLTAYVGGFLLVVAAVLFAVHYPVNFNVATKNSPQTDYMVMDVLIAATGFVMMGAALISSVVGFYLGRTSSVKGEDSEEEDIYGAGYEVPDWVVEKDIEYAMKKYGVQWGEGGKDNDSKTIVVNVADSFAGATIGGLGKARTVQLDADQVDAGVVQLTKTRPQKGGALPSEWADDATRALVAFRKQKEANPKAFKPKRGFWARVGDFFTGRSSQPAPAPVRSTPKVNATVRPNGASAPARRGKTIVIDDEK